MVINSESIKPQKPQCHLQPVISSSEGKSTPDNLDCYINLQIPLNMTTEYTGNIDIEETSMSMTGNLNAANDLKSSS